MGHLTFVGIFCFFLFALFSRIYFGYISAKRNKPNDPAMPIDIPEEGIYLKPKKSLGYFFFALIPIFLVFASFGCFKLWRKCDEGALILFWLLADSILPAVLIFSLATLEAFLTYLFINTKGFEYRGIFPSKKYLKENIENVYRDNEYIFIKCKNKRFPITIDKLYSEQETIYSMLCKLKDMQIEEEKHD